MDTIKQIGKDLRKTSQQAAIAANRVKRNFPLFERVSDYVTADMPFYAEFKTYHSDDQAYISLQFKEDIVGVGVPCNTCVNECCVANDLFDRVVSGSFGGGWTTIGSGPFSVDGSKGIFERGDGIDPLQYNATISPPIEMLFKYSHPSGEWVTEFDFQRLVSGVLQSYPYVYFVLEATQRDDLGGSTGLYFSNVFVGSENDFYSTNGSESSYIYPFDVTKEIYVKVNLSPTSVRGKFWYVEDSEPTDWAVIVPNPGSFSTGWDISQGFTRVVFYASNTGTFYIDDFSICCIECAFETFNRATVFSGWGTSTGGLDWSIITSSAGSSTVSGGMGNLSTLKLTSGSSDPFITMGIETLGPWNTINGWILTSLISYWGGKNLRLTYKVERSDAADSVFVILDESTNSVQGTTAGPVGFTFVEGESYYLKWEMRFGTTDRFKVWNASSSEPGSWTVENSAPSIDPLDQLYFYISQISFDVGTSATSIDYICFE